MKHFFMTPCEIFERGLQPAELSVYCALLMHMNRKTHTAMPSVSTIASITGISENTVRRALKSLVSKGIIMVEKRTAQDGKCLSNTYIICLYAEEYERENVGRVPTEEQRSSFDADEFFNAALLRTQLEGV